MSPLGISFDTPQSHRDSIAPATPASCHGTGSATPDPYQGTGSAMPASYQGTASAVPQVPRKPAAPLGAGQRHRGFARAARALLPACRWPYRSGGDAAKSAVETGLAPSPDRDAISRAEIPALSLFGFWMGRYPACSLPRAVQCDSISTGHVSAAHVVNGTLQS